MTKSRRVEKVSSLLKKEISLILMYELENNLITENLVSVTNIELTTDLQFCKVFITTPASEKIKVEIIDCLNSSKNYIRHLLSKRIVIRRIPDLLFKRDAVFSEGLSVLKILDKLRENKK